MGKKFFDTHRIIKELEKVEVGPQSSKALKRVLKYKKGEGIYLTSQQLIDIGQKLQTMLTGPEGIWFLIGDAIAEGTDKKTVELIPFKLSNSYQPTIFKEDNKMGYLRINSSIDNFINNDTPVKYPHYSTSKGVKHIDDGILVESEELPTAGGPNSQRTPPPTPE